MNTHTLIGLNPDEHNQRLRHYPFLVSLARWNRNCNTVHDPSRRIYVPHKIEDVNLNVFTMIARLNESKTLKKTYFMYRRCKCDCNKCNVNQKWNNCKYWCHCASKEDYVLDLSICVCEIDEYLENYVYMKSLTNDSPITFDEIILFLTIKLFLSIIIANSFYFIEHRLKLK